MNRKEVVAVAVRLFSIVLFLYGLKYFLQSITVFFEQGDLEIAAYVYTGFSILIALIALLFWLFPYTIASVVLPKKPLKTGAVNWNCGNVLSCSFIILGMYFLYYVITDAVYWFYVINYSNNFGIAMELTSDNRASIFSTVIEFVMSVFLILGSSGIARLILKMRGRGNF